MENLNENLNEDQLKKFLLENSPNILNKIPLHSILAFKLMQNDTIFKVYSRKNFKNEINFQELKIIKQKIAGVTNNQVECRELFIKFDDFWIGAMELLDFEFYMVVSSKIAIDHFKFQMMNMFEIFSNKLKYL